LTLVRFYVRRESVPDEAMDVLAAKAKSALLRYISRQGARAGKNNWNLTPII
jgi:hypothetical protein